MAIMSLNRLNIERWAASSWNTNPWSMFCDPHCELICCNKWHPGISVISNPLKIAVGMHFPVWTWHYNYLGIFNCSWSLLPSSISLLSGGSLQPENIYSCILTVTGQFWESQKGWASTPITSTTSIHLPKLVSTDLTLKSDSVLTNLVGKDGVWG